MNNHHSDQLTLFDNPQDTPVKCESCGQVEPNQYILITNHGRTKYEGERCWKQMRKIWQIQSALRNPCMNYLIPEWAKEAHSLGLSESDWETPQSENKNPFSQRRQTRLKGFFSRPERTP